MTMMIVLSIISDLLPNQNAPIAVESQSNFGQLAEITVRYGGSEISEHKLAAETVQY